MPKGRKTRGFLNVFFLISESPHLETKTGQESQDAEHPP